MTRTLKQSSTISFLSRAYFLPGCKPLVILKTFKLTSGLFIVGNHKKMASELKTFKRLVVKKLSSNFREAVIVDQTNMCYPQKGEICIRNKFVGINATDVNITKGSFATADTKMPFGIGFEGVGEVVALGEGVEHLREGDKVAYMNTKVNSYSEYVCVSASEVYQIPEEKPEYLAFLVGGVAASIGLDKCARITAGERVLIAAAGGVGHIAVQWAKAAGCHVIGTCSSKEKEDVLKDLGCDRVVNYKKENLADVLSNEYESGIDVIWETIGGEVLQTCVKNLAVKGRLILVGGISSYKSNKQSTSSIGLPQLSAFLITKCASVHGFRRGAYRDCFSTYFKFLTENFQGGQLRTVLDDGGASTGEEFFGMEGIVRGVEHLQSGKNIGKVIARLY